VFQYYCCRLLLLLQITMGRHGFSFDATRGGEPRREKEKSLGGEVKKKEDKKDDREERWD